MKGTKTFREIVWNYLLSRAEDDDRLRDRLYKEEKNIDDCVTYILNQVKQSQCCGFADEEIFDMALHYYDEDDIEIGEKIDSSRIVVNCRIELTEEEKEKERQKALQKYQDEELAKLRNKKNKAKEEKQEDFEPLNLFSDETEN